MNRLNNTNRQKFINYQTVGTIYTTYLLREDGVPEQAEKIMSQAIEDLSEYQGEDSSKFDYAFSDELSEIYYRLAKNTESPDYYRIAINYCKEVVNLITGEVDVSKSSTNDNVIAYINSYVNKSCRIAEIYSILGEEDNAIKTYVDTEEKLGKTNPNAAKVYVEHLNSLYASYEAEQQDPEKWSVSKRKNIVDVFNEGSNVPGISNNPNWLKRTSTMEMLRSMGSEVKSED